jgi:diaminopimelate decarboxylase
MCLFGFKGIYVLIFLNGIFPTQLIILNMTIQGISPLDLCERYGTPLYVYDAQIIENQYKILRGAFSSVPKLRINYAIKALTNLSVLKFMHRIGACVDCVSIEEVKICLSVGFAPEQIGYTPSGVQWSEIEEAVALKVKMHLDSVPLMQRFGERFGSTVPVGLRLNPHILAGGNFKISTAHEKSKFGISILQLDEIHVGYRRLAPTHGFRN